MPAERLSVNVSSKQVSLVSFAHGTIRSKSYKRKLNIHAFKETRPKPGTKRKRIMVAQTEKMLYKGDNYGPQSSSTNDTSQLFVAFVNKETKSVTMHPAEIFNLHPILQDKLNSEVLDMQDKSYQEKSDVLIEAFGSGKQKKALNRRRENKMADMAVTSAMSSAFDSAAISQQNLPAVAVQATSSVVPPFNKEAATPADVYKLHDIIGTAEIESLKNAGQVLCQCGQEEMEQWSEQKEYFPSVLSRLRVLPMNEEQRLMKACLLLYLQYMMTLYSYNAASIRKKDPLPSDWPDLVKAMMLNRFTLQLTGTRPQRCLPARLKDLLLNHILVLCLILDDFSISLGLLQKDLKLSSRKIAMHARAIGCKTKSSSHVDEMGLKIVTYEAQLTVPLTFPEPSAGRKSKKS